MGEKYKLVCPTCGNIRKFSCRQSFCHAKKSTRCRKCQNRFKDKWKQELSPEQYEKKLNEYREKISKIVSGTNNPMSGKTMYSVWLEKYGKEEADKRKAQHAENSRKNNKKGMTGKSVYSVWLEKYGKEEADRRMNVMRKKLSITSSGKNNPMYGKETPCGSGNGWKGWYKNWYFRSLRELSYVLNVLEKNNLSWIPAESNKFRIKYKSYDGNDRTYKADFIVDNKYMIEIKPHKLQNTPLVILKKEAGELFCKQNNLEYKLCDCEIDTEKIIDLYEKGFIIFSERYKNKMDIYIKLRRNNEQRKE